MALFDTFVTGVLAQVPIYLMRWLVAATIILSRDLGRVDLSGRDGALKPGAAGTTIATIFIALILLVVLARSLSFDKLGAMRRHGSCLVRVERKGALVPSVILGSFWDGAVTPGAASIHLTDPQREVESGFDHSHNSLLNGLVPGVLWQPFCSTWGRMEGLRPLRNRRIKTGSEIIALASNSRRTVCRCSSWAAQSIISSNWC